MSDTDQTEDQQPLSKTRRKAAMHALQDLGQELLALSNDRLAQLDLPEILFDAIREGKRISAHGAMARHRQYIGKLMREIDTAPISEQLARWKGLHQEDNARFHQLEKWRERLLQDDQALSELLARYPQADSQHLRTLIRNARKEAEQMKPPRSSRELFKQLRALTESAPASAGPA